MLWSKHLKWTSIPLSNLRSGVKNGKLTIKIGGWGVGVERVNGGKLGSQINCFLYFVNLASKLNEAPRTGLKMVPAY